MHEVGLASTIVDMVETAARREQFSRVARLHLEAGCLAGVDPDALHFALTAMVPGTCLAFAEITITSIAGTAWCPQCADMVEITHRAQPCPDCGALMLRALGGAGLSVRDLVVFEETQQADVAAHTPPASAAKPSPPSANSRGAADGAGERRPCA